MRVGTTPGCGIIRAPCRPVSVTLDNQHHLDPVLDFMRLLWSIEHGLQKMSKRMESEIGITGPQRLVLRVVGRFPGLSAGELAHIVRLHPSTNRKGFFNGWSREICSSASGIPGSRRARLRLKPRAVVYTRSSPGTVEKAVTQALKHVGASNVRVAQRVLAEIAERLNEL